MSEFPAKQYLGQRYEFDHLKPMQVSLSFFDATGASHQMALQVSFSSHCFTEAFDFTKHQDHHRYTFKQELRAFDPQRYECSLSLPGIIQGLARCKVYRASNSNYTYVAQIKLDGTAQAYSLFFQLKPNALKAKDALKMYVQSAYLSPLKAARNAQSWRFTSLVGLVTGVFDAKDSSKRPKKKTP